MAILQGLCTYFSHQARITRRVDVMDHLLDNLSTRNFTRLLTVCSGLTQSAGHDPMAKTALLGAIDRVAASKTLMGLQRASALAEKIANDAGNMRSRISVEFSAYAETCTDHDDRSGKLTDYLQRVKPKDLARETLEEAAAGKWKSLFQDELDLRLTKAAGDPAAVRGALIDAKIQAVLSQANGSGYFMRRNAHEACLRVEGALSQVQQQATPTPSAP